MREGTKREMRIYQDPKLEFLCNKRLGEETTKRNNNKKRNKTIRKKKNKQHKKRQQRQQQQKTVKGLPWGWEHIAWRAAMKTKVEEDFRF